MYGVRLAPGLESRWAVACTCLVTLLTALGCSRPATPRSMPPSEKDTPPVIASGPFTEARFPFCANRRWGYIDATGHVAIQPQFDMASDFSDGLAYVHTGDNDAFIDTRGRIVFSPDRVAESLNLVARFHENLAAFCSNGHWGYFRRTGKIAIRPQFTDARDFAGGLAPVYVGGEMAGVVPMPQGGNWGFVDKTGRLVIPAQFGDAESFSEGLARVSLRAESCFIARTGEVRIRVVAPRSKDAAYAAGPFSAGFARVIVGSGRSKTGFIDKIGKFVIQPHLDAARDFCNAMAAAKAGPAWGYINTKGTMVIRPRFGDARDFHEGLAAVLIGSEWHYVDMAGVDRIG